jgi:hypothetical protein
VTAISPVPSAVAGAPARSRWRWRPSPAPLSWGTVLSLSAVMAYADGFWLTSLQGAVGAIERSQGPFLSWLQTSTLVLPLFVLAVLGAVSLLRRRFRGALNTPKMVIAAMLLIVGAGTAAGTAQAVAAALYDYRLQSAQIQMIHGTHGSDAATEPEHHLAGSCTAACSERAATLRLHIRAVTYVTGIILATNLVLVTWIVAMWGGQLAAATRRMAQPVAN